ncbi:hypothetical protein [Oceanihabitans sediminis]|uniref:hypothetical protein n=1 Tax=Oceanihabitans sediminis TaxID=1812012 RepID=UPI00299E4E3B|nr:hypothetical protein [Oceanihabitans sediminis]MDX1279020.1 hypothetical protein [Oceanihabitans sediminis]
MNVNRVKTDQIKGDKLELIFFGDQHIGSKDSDMEAIQKQIDWIKNKKNVLVILMGDTVNCALKGSVGAGSYDDTMNPDQQIDTAIEIFTPIKEKILGIHNGNHGNRVYNETTISPEKVISQALNVPYLGDTCFHHIRFGNQTYIVHTAHGSTGATTVGGALNSCMKYANFNQADLYAMGHTHNLATYNQVYHEVSKKDKTMLKKKKFFVLTGGYLKWKGSYAEAKAYAPLKIGCAKATLNGERHDIHVSV